MMDAVHHYIILLITPINFKNYINKSLSLINNAEDDIMFSLDIPFIFTLPLM